MCVCVPVNVCVWKIKQERNKAKPRPLTPEQDVTQRMQHSEDEANIPCRSWWTLYCCCFLTAHFWKRYWWLVVCRCKFSVAVTTRVGSGCEGSCEQKLICFIKKQQVCANAVHPVWPLKQTLNSQNQNISSPLSSCKNRCENFRKMCILNFHYNYIKEPYKCFWTF